MKNKYIFFIVALLVASFAIPWSAVAQSAATIPYVCDYESQAERGSWSFVNGTCHNHFCISTDVNTTDSGNYALYVTQQTQEPYYYGYKIGSSGAGDETYVQSRVFATREITFTTAGEYNVSYWWKCLGETIYDYGRVALVPAGWTFAASTVAWDTTTSVQGEYFGSHSLPSTWICLDRGYNLSGASSFQFYAGTFTITTPGTYQIVVLWQNDGNTGENSPLMIDDLTITENTCSMPSDLLVERSYGDSVWFSWTANGTATSWIVEYDTATVMGNFAYRDTVTTPSYAIGGLVAGATYNLNVRAVCGAGNESMPLFHQITMPTCSLVGSLPYAFNFDSAASFGSASEPFEIPCWVHINTAASSSYQGYPYLSTTAAGLHTGSHALYWYQTSSVGNAAIVMRGLDTTINMREVVLSFWAKVTSTSYIHRFVVGVMGNPYDIHSLQVVDTITVSNIDYREFTVPFTGYTGRGNYVAIQQIDPAIGTYSYAYMDDLLLTIETCPRPAPEVSLLTDSSATLRWIATGALYYEITDSADAVTGVQVNSTTISFNNLSANTEYTYYLRSVCSSGYGEWQPVTFRTHCGLIKVYPWEDDFENTPGSGSRVAPYCWDFYSNGIGSSYNSNYYPYVYSTTSSRSGEKSIYMMLADTGYNMQYGYPMWNMMVMPPVDTTVVPLDELRLSFWYKKSSSSYNINAVVGMLGDLSDSNSFVGIDTLVMTGSNYVLYELDLLNYGHTDRVAVKFYNTTQSMNSSIAYGYADDFKLIRIPDCPRVQELTAVEVGQTYATLSWSDSNEVYDWFFALDSTGHLPDWTVPVNTNGDTFYTFYNLTPNTTYTFYVMPDCEGGIGEETSITFTTRCTYLDSLPYTMGFEGLATSSSTTKPTIPCWEHYNNAQNYIGYPYISSSSSYCHSGTRGLYWYGSNAVNTDNYGTDVALIAPPINREQYNINQVTVKFWTRASSSTYTPTYAVGVMTNPLDMSTFVPCDTVSMTGTTWTELSASLISYTDTGCYIAIKQALSGPGAYWYSYFDDITLEYSACPMPLVSATATIDSVYVSWIGTAGSYEVTITAEGATAPESSVTTSNSTYAFGNLTSNTTYTIAVRQNCSGTYSDWGETSITTECAAITTVPYFYDFENAATGTSAKFPACWKRFSNATTYAYYPYVTTHTSTLAGTRRLYWYAGMHESYGDYFGIVLPQINTDVLDVSDLSLSFYTKTTNEAYEPTFYIGVMTDPTDNNTFVAVDSITFRGQDWRMSVTDFSSYAGNGSYIAVKGHRPDTASEVWYAYTDDFTIYATPSCIAPSRFYKHNITATGAVIGWERNNGASNFLVEYSDGTSTWSQTCTTDSVVLTGLTPNTVYTVTVRAICNATDTSDIGEVMQLRTGCAIMTTLPYFESFENESTGGSSNTSFVNCWNRLNDGTSYFGYPYVSASTSYAHTGDKGLYWYNSNTTVTYGSYQCVVLPEVDNTIYPANELKLSFWAKASSTSYHPEFYVGVMTDPDSIETFVVVDTVNVEGTAWTEYEADLSSYVGTGSYVAVKAVQSTTAWYAYVDDFTLDVSEINILCAAPTALASSNVTATDVDLSWSGSTAAYIVSVSNGVNTFAFDTVVADTAVSLTNLHPAMQYQWTVRSLCGTSDTSAPAEAASFTTDICDDAVYDTIGNFNVTDFCAYLPTYEYYQYSYSQQIIDNSELGYFFNIDALEIWSTTATANNDSCNIYIGHTGRTAFASTTDWVPLDSLTLVWSGNMNMEFGWNLYGFDTTFVYDGESSIVIAVVRKALVAGTSTIREVCQTVDVKTLYAYSNAAFTPGSTTGVQSNYRNYMRLSTCDGLPCQAPALATPAVTYNSAHVAWQGNSEVYEIDVTPAMGASWSNEPTVVSDSVYTFNDLLPATSYIYRVRGVCAADDISPWSTGTFVTDSLPCYVPANVMVESSFGSAQISWNEDASLMAAWSIEVWNNTYRETYTTTAHSYTVTGLTPGVEYNVAVRAVCGEGLASSAYSDTIAFTTTLCDPVSNVTVTPEGTRSATVSWTAGENNTGMWLIEYGYTDFASGTGTQVQATETSVTLEGLEEETDYDVYVRALCDDSYGSLWSEKVSFSTDGTGILTADEHRVNIYPNPVVDYTTISVAGIEGTVTVTLVAVDGRTISSEQLACSSDCVKTLELSNLAAGTYFVRVQGSGINCVKKLIVK